MARAQKRKANRDPDAIGVRALANGTSYVIHVGPVISFAGGWMFHPAYKPSFCVSVASARRTVTRWQRKLGIQMVRGCELLGAPW